MLDLILQLCSVIIPSVAAIIGLIIGLVKSIKKYKKAKTDAEKLAAKNEIAEAAKGIVSEVEGVFNNSTSTLKSFGVNTGALKKDSAMAKLQSFALSRNYSFDSEYWSQYVDNLVELTKSVNTNKVTMGAVNTPTNAVATPANGNVVIGVANPTPAPSVIVTPPTQT